MCSQPFTSNTRPSTRVHVLIDGANLRGQLPALGARSLDPHRLRRWAGGYGRPDIKWFQGNYEWARGFLNQVRMSGARVIAPAPKPLPGGALKCDLDVALAVEAMKHVDRYATVILGSGDGDFEPLLQELSLRGVRIVVLSGRRCLAPELLQHVEPEDFVDLASVIDDLSYGAAA